MTQSTKDWMEESAGEKQASRGAGLPQLKLRDGEKVQVRFISKRKEACINWKEHNEHPRIVSPKTTDANAKCYFTELAERTGDKSKFPKWRCYILVLNRTKNNELQLWDFSMTTKAEIRKILENRFDVQDSPGGLMDFDLMISRKGSSMEDTEYSIVIAKKPTPLTKEEKDYIAQCNYDLDKEFEPVPYDTVRGWMEGNRGGGGRSAGGAGARSSQSAPSPQREEKQQAAASVSSEDTLF